MTAKYLTLYGVKNVGEVIDDEQFVALYLTKAPIKLSA
jgi:hypothetical protein